MASFVMVSGRNLKVHPSLSSPIASLEEGLGLVGSLAVGHVAMRLRLS